MTNVWLRCMSLSIYRVKLHICLGNYKRHHKPKIVMTPEEVQEHRDLKAKVEDHEKRLTSIEDLIKREQGDENDTPAELVKEPTEGKEVSMPADAPPAE